MTTLVLVAALGVVSGCGALYVAVLWRLLRRFGGVAVLAAWVVLTFCLAYLTSRQACSQALACDVRGADLSWVYNPILPGAFGIPLGLCALLVLRTANRSERPSRRLVLTGATICLVWCFAAPLLLTTLYSVTCGNRALRRADGSYDTECVILAEEKASERAHASR